MSNSEFNRFNFEAISRDGLIARLKAADAMFQRYEARLIDMETHISDAYENGVADQSRKCAKTIEAYKNGVADQARKCAKTIERLTENVADQSQKYAKTIERLTENVKQLKKELASLKKLQRQKTKTEVASKPVEQCVVSVDSFML